MSSQREGSFVAMKLAKTLFFASLSILVFFTILTTSADTISPTQSIKDGETLVSPKEEYELGFFNPGTSTNKYLGIWYKKISTPTIVWVANRNFPITDSSGVLKFGTDGILVVVNGSAGIVWSSNVSKAVNPIAQIMDNGNFVIREQGNLDPEQYLWQSFDYPTDTLIPGMKVGWDLKKGLGRYLTSWKNQNDPSLGDYTYGIDLHGIPQGYVYKKNVTILRTGSWNGAQFAGVPGISQNYIFNFSYTINRDEVSYAFYVKNDSYYSRLVLNYSTGQIQRYTWLNANKVWNMFWYIPNDDCDTYMQCGVYGVCNGDHEISGYPICNCTKGFEPKNAQDWYLREWSGGCVLKTKYECQKTDGFLLMKNLKIPDTSQASVNENWNLDRCGVECRRNCSCKAYATYNVTNGGSGCIIWTDDLRDLRKYADGGQDLYVRVAASEIETSVLPREIVSGKGKKKLAKTIIIISAVSATFILGFSVCFIWRKRMFKNIQVERLVYKAKNQDPPFCEVFVHGKRDYYGEKDDIELNLFDMVTIVRATDNFDNTNLLGQGGFGCVYKGTWDNGQVVAVKRLSKNSGQGAEEFKNEVILIARLQHRNLVRLLGGCVEGEEKMLVYEYMENKGLDSILFNKEYSFLLDWPKRFNIIVGISRGLLYLHQDSRFRIVHRDLKASNVLLDGEMHPKISDFGMARIFGGDDTEAKTKRVVGTYGYMSPEYAMDGLFSVKSDVFSFGVLVLEIISGRRNKGFFCSDDQLNLLGHAWSLWNEGHALEVIDEAMEDTYLPNEALRCIQVGLLCVQERAEDRPTMSSVVLMLSSDSATLPQPKQPGFCYTISPIDTDSTSTKQESVNKVTVTMLQPR